LVFAYLLREIIMAASAPFLRVALFGLLVTACDSGPLGVTAPRVESGVAGSVAGASKTPISGSIDLVAALPPGRTRVTPSGRCHLWDYPVITHFGGDVSGTVTFREQAHAPCDFSDFVASGPFEGEVTWNGRSGVISGQWTTNCNADPSQPIGLSCDGTMNARGTGGLEGVQFHFKWGPGWYPFPYTGTAFSH
jgi:hypothetical protein